MAAQAGKSIMSDEEYDELKRKLRNKNSKVVQQVAVSHCSPIIQCFSYSQQSLQDIPVPNFTGNLYSTLFVQGTQV